MQNNETAAVANYGSAVEAGDAKEIKGGKFGGKFTQGNMSAAFIGWYHVSLEADDLEKAYQAVPTSDRPQFALTLTHDIQKLIDRAHNADVVMSQTMTKLKADLTKNDDAAARVDLDAITRIEEGAQRQKAEALRDANQLEPTTSPTEGSGTVAVNPSGPFGGYDQYVATLSMDPTQVQKDHGFTLVFPNGYAGGAGAAGNYTCSNSSSSFESGNYPYVNCQWYGTGNAAASATVPFYFHTPIASTDNGKVMACYGLAAIGWRSPAPPGCFYLKGP